MHALATYIGRIGRVLAVWVIWSGCCPSVSVAQDPPSLHNAQNARNLNWWIQDESAIRFQMSLGRIVLQPGRFKLDQRHEGSGTDDAPLQSICIQLNSGIPSVEYFCKSASESFSLSCTGLGAAKIQHTFSVEPPQRGGSAETPIWVTATMDQPQVGPIEFSVIAAESASHSETTVPALTKSGDQSDSQVRLTSVKTAKNSAGDSPFRTVESRSLWHLWIAEPEWADAYFAPMLARIHHRWSLASDCSRIENRLVEAIRLERSVDNQTIQDFVKQLGNSDSWVRVYAERQLMAIGLSSLPRLEKIDQSKLDSETRFRLERVIRGMFPAGEDSATRVATWLSGDAELCQTISDRSKWPTNQEVLLRQVEFLKTGAR